MSTTAEVAAPGSRMARLLGFVEQDPANLSLLADAAAAALDEGDTQTAQSLVQRYAALSPPPPGLLNIDALAALRAGRFEEAGDGFRKIMDGGHADPALRFNLAWARAMAGHHEEAAALLADADVLKMPRAAALHIEMLHHLGRFEDALTAGAAYAEARPGDAALMAALAVAALDAERLDLAKTYAEAAGEHPDGLAALGMWSLNNHEVAASTGAFERALALDPNNARALLGKGLGQIAQDQAGTGAQTLDAAAEAFGDHLGTWIAAGWAYFVRNDYATARQRFETALALDDTFAECHGSLAVMDAIEGRREDAERRVEVALRLDRQCFSAALARTLLLASAGDAEGAARVRDIALNTPITPGGATIAEALVRMGLGPVRR